MENNIITNLFLLLFTVGFILFYLDNFKLSSIYIIKWFQIFSFFSVLIIFILYVSDINLINLICCANDKDINLHGHVTVGKEAGKAIGQGLNTIGSQ
jgi:energy-coupling factor transporter transmembrane protein EcfT